ncbi:MAG TPA: ATP-binding protein [Pyrinomonadaceae bacterium]|nr:ATP-binding protein [Pyrinomonadaceae bacterium]
MRETEGGNWHETNQHYLAARLATVRERLALHAAGACSHGRDVGQGAEGAEDPLGLWSPRADAPGATPPALETLTSVFSLSPFECELLLLCAGMELDADFPRLCAEAQGDARRSYPTFSLALAALPDPHWDALTPAAPLRRWRLVEVTQGPEPLVHSPLKIDERVLHYLAGVSYLDERLQGIVEAVAAPSEELPPSHAESAALVAGLWGAEAEGGVRPAVALCGNDAAAKRAVAAAACAERGLRLHALRAADLPQTAAEREALACLWEREAILQGGALLVEAEESEAAPAVVSFVEGVRGFVLVASREALRARRRPAVRVDVNRPAAAEQHALWRRALGPAAEELNGQLDALVSQFSLGTDGIRAASAQARAAYAADAQVASALWDACRAHVRPRLEDLAQRIEPAAAWDDLVLPAPQKRVLAEIAGHVRRRALVYDGWGFGARGERGLGLSALFAGPSGTGKTMAAEVLAGELRLDLYRIDLSQVVSKYIGETEKNLRRVFDAAEEGGAILLFDEADALFGKRSEVKDSHDRYANIEISYLLQRMESYRGLAILTTNLKPALDSAFVRRLRFVVLFPFPDATTRADIWRRVFPADVPTEGLDAAKLGRLNVAGGHIRNIALHAAFLAAEAGEPVRMAHLLRAAQTEYAKLEKPLTEAEKGGWV